MALSRDEIVSAAGVLPERVEAIPQWGGDIRFRGLDAGHRLQILALLREPGGHEYAMLTLVSMCIVDDEGNRIFDDPAGREAVGKFNPDGFLAAVDVAQDLSGLQPVKTGEEPAPL